MSHPNDPRPHPPQDAPGIESAYPPHDAGHPTPAPGGYAPPGYHPPPQPAAGNGLATTGFVLGLLGFLGAWIPLLNVIGILLAVLGVIFAITGLVRASKVGTGKGLAVTGLVLGAVAIVVAVVINVVVLGAVDSAVQDATSTTVDVPAGSDASSEASDSDTGSTRSDPAPLGSAVSGGDWTVTINSVTTADEDSYGSTPDPGKTLLVVNLTATYTGDDDQGSTAWATVKYVSPDGTSVDSTDGFWIPEDKFDSLKTVYNGGSITGNRMFEVPADSWEDGVLAVSPALFRDDTFIALS